MNDRFSNNVFGLLSLLAIGLTVVTSTQTHAEGTQRVLVLREGKSAQLLDGAFEFKLLKITGYFVDIRVAGERRTLKMKDRIEPPGVDCAIVFNKISPETRIARFYTDCPGMS